MAKTDKTREYVSMRKNSLFASIDISPVGRDDGNIVAFHLAPFTEKKEARKWLQESGMMLEILAETASQEGRVLVVRSALGKNEILDGLKQNGQAMKAPEIHSRFDPWRARGSLSVVGQILQFLSGIMQKGPPGWDTIIFAISNLMANFTNIVFGGEKATDSHQLRYLKNRINVGLLPYIKEGGILPDLDANRFALRAESRNALEHGGFYNFMKRHSVTLGEVGLRMFGAFALAFPTNNWKAMGSALKAGDIKGALEKGVNRNKDTHEVSYTAYAGFAYLIGKVIALFSKIPDPYNPKKESGLDKLRERVFFNASSAIETMAAGFLSYDAFANKSLDN